jgi:hypothetical protein
MNERPAVGSIGWTDLTVPNAEEVRDFYQEVVGWKPEPVEMGGYADFNMTDAASGQPRAGVCHARGVNADLPPAWMIYIIVADIDASTESCRKLGGELLTEIKDMGGQGRYCVIRDPGGAVAALYQPAEAAE